MNVGVFGGTFDPPHYGHLIMAEMAREELNLKKVLWATAAQPPHKQADQISPASHRLAMVELAIQGNECFSSSRVDIDRPGPHYTVDMLRILTQENPERRLVLIIGADSLLDLPDWHQPERLNDYAEIVAIARSGHQPDLDALMTQYPAIYRQARILNLPLIELSGRMIRERVAAGKSLRYMTPSDVENYIHDHALYQ